MRPCVSGLMDYAANLALTGEQNLIPDLREMVVSIGPFWEDSGDERPGWRQAREQHYGETFDQVVSAAKKSGQAPVMDSKKIEQIFAGLNYHAEERSADLDTWNVIKEAAVAVWNGLKDFFSNIWNAITGAAQSIWNGLKSFFSGLWDGIKNIFQTVLDVIQV